MSCFIAGTVRRYSGSLYCNAEHGLGYGTGEPGSVIPYWTNVTFIYYNSLTLYEYYCPLSRNNLHVWYGRIYFNKTGNWWHFQGKQYIRPVIDWLGSRCQELSEQPFRAFWVHCGIGCSPFRTPSISPYKEQFFFWRTWYIHALHGCCIDFVGFCLMLHLPEMRIGLSVTVAMDIRSKSMTDDFCPLITDRHCLKRSWTSSKVLSENHY